MAVLCSYLASKLPGTQNPPPQLRGAVQEVLAAPGQLKVAYGYMNVGQALKRLAYFFVWGACMGPKKQNGRLAYKRPHHLKRAHFRAPRSRLLVCRKLFAETAE